MKTAFWQTIHVKGTRETTARGAMDPDVWHIIGTCISAEDFWHTLLCKDTREGYERNSMAAANTKPILISNVMYGTLSSPRYSDAFLAYFEQIRKKGTDEVHGKARNQIRPCINHNKQSIAKTERRTLW